MALSGTEMGNLLHFRGDGRTLIYMSNGHQKISKGQRVAGMYCGGRFTGTVDEFRMAGWQSEMMEVRVIVDDAFDIEGRTVAAKAAILMYVRRTSWLGDFGDWMREIM